MINVKSNTGWVVRIWSLEKMILWLSIKYVKSHLLASKALPFYHKLLSSSLNAFASFPFARIYLFERPKFPQIFYWFTIFISFFFLFFVKQVMRKLSECGEQLPGFTWIFYPSISQKAIHDSSPSEKILSSFIAHTHSLILFTHKSHLRIYFFHYHHSLEEFFPYSINFFLTQLTK